MFGIFLMFLNLISLSSHSENYTAQLLLNYLWFQQQSLSHAFSKADLLFSQALQCCIAGVKPVTGSWTGECTIAVRQMITGKSLTFTVLDIMNDGALLAVDVPLSMLGRAYVALWRAVFEMSKIVQPCNLFLFFLIQVNT